MSRPLSAPRRAVPPAVRSALIGLLLVASLVTPPVAEAASATIREELNLRAGPGLGYAVIVVMPAGAAVTVADEATEGWYPVVYNGQGGWAYGAYLSIDGITAAGVPASTSGTATVVTAELNMRSGPGFDFRIVTTLPYGTTVEIVDGPQNGNGYSWLRVRAAQARMGWVAAQYLDAGGGRASSSGGGSVAPPPPPPPAPAPAAPARTGNAMVDIITDAAVRYGQSPSAMLAVARCESNLDPNVVNRSSGASGLFQFMPGTWRTTPYASSSIFDPWANANAAAWMWSVGRRGEWVC